MPPPRAPPGRWLSTALTAAALVGRAAPALGLGDAEVRRIERERQRCARSRAYRPARKAFDLNETLGPILRGEAWAELKPTVKSTDPWIIHFENFLSEEEAKALEYHLFEDPKRTFNPSPAGNSGESHAGLHHARHSETAFCIQDCDSHRTIQSVRNRASAVTKVPAENFDLSQALRYRQGMFYREHHDNHPTFHLAPTGARIFTFFVYFNDDGVQGGETRFPRLDIKVPPTRGGAVLFANTKDRNPQETDPRTAHESMTVLKGEKRGMNMWLYQYNYREFWQMGCTTIELADDLGRIGKAAEDVEHVVHFENNAAKAKVQIYEGGPNFGSPRKREDLESGKSVSLTSVEGNFFQVRGASGGKVLKEYPVLRATNTRVRVGGGGKKKQEEL